jgi:hypothetical protein
MLRLRKVIAKTTHGTVKKKSLPVMLSQHDGLSILLSSNLPTVQLFRSGGHQGNQPIGLPTEKKKKYLADDHHKILTGRIMRIKGI